MSDDSKKVPAKGDSVVLIGMPGSGKSTIGVQLAKWMGLEFIDTDILIQVQEGRQLQDIQDNDGYQVLRAIEAGLLKELQLSHRALVSTGGSAIYSEVAMSHLRGLGTIVFLDVGVTELQRRIDNEGERGIARSQGQSFVDIFNERLPLYQRYADITYDNERPIDIASLAQRITDFQRQ